MDALPFRNSAGADLDSSIHSQYPPGPHLLAAIVGTLEIAKVAKMKYRRIPVKLLDRSYHMLEPLAFASHIAHRSIHL